MNNERYIEALNSKLSFSRLSALKKLAKAGGTNGEKTYDTALQLHSYFSFSPYSPALAVFMASKFGLRVCGLMDNYSLQGAKEFIKASRILGVTYSIGTKVRVELNLPEIKVCDVAIMGVASPFIDPLHQGLEAYRKNQLENIKRTVSMINKRFKKYNIEIDFEKDVVKAIKYNKDKVFLSKYAYLALSNKLLKKFDVSRIIEILKENQIELDENELKLLTSSANPYRNFDLAKAFFLRRKMFYADKNYLKGDSICPLAHKYGAICSVVYRRYDVLEFNDKNVVYVNSLLNEVKKRGFDGVTFDPNMMDDKMRNYFLDTMAELELLPFALNEVEFARQDFCISFPDERSREVMEKSAYLVVGSEMSQNQTAEGFIMSTLKTVSFEEKVDLFSRIGRGE